MLRTSTSVKLHRSFALVLTLAFACVSLPVFAAVSERDAISALETTQAGFRSVHAKVSPAVVYISSKMNVSSAPGDLFDMLFGPSSSTQIKEASGSGVIIRNDGYILTNSHVVEGATKVSIKLDGSDNELAAEVVQTDPRTDLAIVKIVEKGTYPTAKLGDAGVVQAGDWSIAFGSPFGLTSTMTVGVISATGRKLRDPGEKFMFSDLLQTDASINPGNSGGPLANLNGEIIGINFMIYSPGSRAGSVGIGFAIPINSYTKQIISTLIEGRAFERGLLGVRLDNLDAAMRELYGVKEGGILINEIMPGQAADKAGLKAEDVVIKYNDTLVTDADQFVRLVEMTPPGTKITLTIIRDKQQQTVNVTTGGMTASNSVDEKKIGMTVTTLTANIAQQLRIPFTDGAIVTKITDGGMASNAGFKVGDVITRVGTTNISSEEEFWSTLRREASTAKNGVVLRVRRGSISISRSLPLTANTK